MKRKPFLKVLIISIGLVLVSNNIWAGKVTTGEFVLTFDNVALSKLSSQPKNIGWFDAQDSVDKTSQELSQAASDDEGAVPYQFTFKVFAEAIPTPPLGLADRFPQASTFEYSYEASDESFSATGKIGLAGLHVVTTSEESEGPLVLGDYDLSFDASRLNNVKNGSGLILTNNNISTFIAFDLAKVSSIIDDEKFSLIGEVVLSKEFALMAGKEDEAGTKVGIFTFTTVAEPDVTVDASIPNFSFETEILKLFMVINDITYSASFLTAPLVNNQYAFDLNSATPTTVTPKSAIVYDTSNNTLNIPKVVILDNPDPSAAKEVEVIMSLGTNTDEGSQFLLSKPTPDPVAPE